MPEPTDNRRHRGLWTPNVPFAPSRWPFFYGWVIVAVATVGIIFSIPGQTMGFSVFTDILMEELGLTRVQLSTAYFVGTLLSGFTLPSMGRLFDRWGARRMAVASAAAIGVILFYLSQTSRITDLVVTSLPSVSRVAVAFVVILFGFYLIRASAQGVLTMTSRNAIGKWFDYHRGTALAVSGVICAFMFSMAPRGLDALIGWFGWDGAWMFLGVLSLTVMVGIGWLFFRDNPEECGLVMDGPRRSERERKPHADSLTHRDYRRGEALRTWAFWNFNLSFAFFALFSTAFTFQIISIGAEMGRERAEILSFFVPMAIVSVVVSFFCGWFSSRIRLKYLIMLMNAGGVFGVLGTMRLDTTWGAVAYIAGNGIAGGCYSSLMGIVWPRFFGRMWLGAISGFNMSTNVIASAVGPVVFSISLAVTGGYETILKICLVVPAVLFFASLKADNPQWRDAPPADEPKGD